MIIVGDIGATKTLLQLIEVEGSSPRVVAERRYLDSAYGDFASLLSAFLAEAGVGAPGKLELDVGVFGIAAPITSDRVRLTNRNWEIDAKEISSAFDIRSVRLVNDFAAAARGIDMLAPGDLAVLQAGKRRDGAPRVVLGAGSGLGVAYLVSCDGRCQVIAGERGNAGLAPATPLQAQLWLFLHERLPHVCVEEALSGRGLVAIYEFLREQGAAGESPELGRLAASEEGAESITRFALEKGDRLASLALDLFVEVYGTVAGDEALGMLAHGGVFLAGGIAPRIVSRLRDGRFISAFRAKGRYSSLMADFPVRVVVNPRLGLLGAAAVAMEVL